MAFPIGLAITGALELIELYANFARRAATMTEEEADAEWAKVNQRAAAARTRWEQSARDA